MTNNSKTYLAKIDPEDIEQEKIAELGRKDLLFFNKHILGYKDITEEVHGEWQKFKEESKKKFKLILVPREHFKTSYFTIGETVQDLIINPNVRILLTNATLGNAQSFLREIKEHIEKNQKLHYYYPETCNWAEQAAKWTEKQIIIPRTRVSKEPTIETTGVGGNLVSQHYDKIKLDDLVNLENSATRLQSEKVIEYFKYCLSLLETGGELLVIGTRWTYFELYQYILDELKEDFDILIKDCWRDKEKKIPYFPEKFTVEHLDTLKRVQGSYIFSCQYQNSPVDVETAIFKKSYFQYYEKLPDILYITTTVDPNLSEKLKANFGVILTLGQDLRGNLYVLDIIRQKMNPYTLINRMLYTKLKWKPVVIGVEENALQKTLKYFFDEVLSNRGVDLPIAPIKIDNQKSKEMRIAALQPLFENKRIFFPKNHLHTKDLEEELIKFPLARTDDIVDALSAQLQFTQKPDVPKELSPKIPVTMQEKVEKEQRDIARQRPGIRQENPEFVDEILGQEY